ncbi:MAG: DUF2917 domain-containing protein [Rhodoferax sp.]|uniref:DUF2917 domain-containing protein n=1 Tax=Rhodoferax sp. TaxID=50421 RepID=UPI003264E7DD
MAQFPTFTSSFPLSAAALTECWKLDAGLATTLQPRQAGVFRVAQGEVWATVNGMQHGEAELPGDRLLKAGDSLQLQAGQRLVVESWNPAAPAPVYFSWEPVAEVVWDGRREAASAGAQWRGGVVQPSRDLAQALRSAAAAAARLVLGLVGLGDYLVVGRGRTV